MKSDWTDSGAREAIDRWGPAVGEEFALRIYSARLLGANPALVLHGGGNVSLKQTARNLFGEEVAVVHVKASGGDLASLEPEGLPALELEPLQRFRRLTRLDDVHMVGHLRRHLLDPTAPDPSIETLMHAFLPHRFVDHSHADAVLAVTSTARAADHCRDIWGDRVAVVPYVRPGLELALAVAEALDGAPKAEGLILLQHGLVTFGDTARQSYERHATLVGLAEEFLARRGEPRLLVPSSPTDAPAPSAVIPLLPALRGLLAEPTGNEDLPFRRSILEWRGGADLLAWIDSPENLRWADSAAVTGDHVIRTGPWPLVIPSLNLADPAECSSRLKAAVAGHRARYRQYLVEHGRSTDAAATAPRVVLIRGLGAFCWGDTKAQARIAADLTECALRVKSSAAALGGFVGLTDEHLFDMEFRPQQRAKRRADSGPLAGQVVFISGGAGAIGAAVAEVCCEAGAHVALADLNEIGLQRVVSSLQARFGRPAVFPVRMDVTDESSVRAGYEAVTCFFGGVDVLVPNAGIAHVAPVEALELDAFRRVMEVNAVGYLLFMREGIRILKRQGLGGNIVVNASKNVFGPGKDFAAYSASKAAGHQIGKVAALELAPEGIRVNMINADAVFGDKQVPSGLWQTVGPERARSRGLDPADLPEFYRQRNLLRARVTGRHVGNAVVFFATNATPTTGATLPVDGGVPDAFPR